jgi:hypothetical protein
MDAIRPSSIKIAGSSSSWIPSQSHFAVTAICITEIIANTLRSLPSGDNNPQGQPTFGGHYALQSVDNKTQSGGTDITRELERLYKTYVQERIALTFWHRHLRYPLERIRHTHRGLLFGLVYYPYQCAVIALLSPFYGFTRVLSMNWADFG